MNAVAGRAARSRAAQVFTTASATLTMLAMLAALPSLAHAADLAAVNKAAAMSASGASAAANLGAGSAVPSLGFAAVLQTVLGLALVIGIVFGCAWLARKFGLHNGPRNALVKTVGGTSLGGKERVAVVEIGDTWLVLGAAPGNVRLLHTMPAGTLPEAAQTGPASPGNAQANPQGSFGQRFRDALKVEANKRFRRHDGGAQ